MKVIVQLCFFFFMFISPSVSEDLCTLAIKSLNILPNANSDSVFLIQHINGQQSVKHTLTNAHTSIANSPTFDKTSTMVIVIHGWLPSVVGGNDIQNLITTLKNKNVKNVFELDWKKYANTLDYTKAVVNLKKIAEMLGTALAQLDATGVYGYHVIGHSLGAHMSGFIGKKFNSILSDKIDRITGLDPAFSCFFNEEAKDRLDSSDGVFVDVIHTDPILGMSRAIGHVDFYPNGGDKMPGLLNIDHLMCIKYFAESVNNNNFVSVKCADWNTFKTGACKTNTPQVKMGFVTDLTARGKYYLRTKASSLYALGTAGLT